MTQPKRLPPTVPLYVRIPVPLREAIDRAQHDDQLPPWRTRRLSDVIIRALYEAFLPSALIMNPPTPSPPPPEPEPPPPTKRRSRRA